MQSIRGYALSNDWQRNNPDKETLDEKLGAPYRYQAHPRHASEEAACPYHRAARNIAERVNILLGALNLTLVFRPEALRPVFVRTGDI